MLLDFPLTLPSPPGERAEERGRSVTEVNAFVLK